MAKIATKSLRDRPVPRSLETYTRTLGRRAIPRNFAVPPWGYVSSSCGYFELEERKSVVNKDGKNGYASRTHAFRPIQNARDHTREIRYTFKFGRKLRTKERSAGARARSRLCW